ncbi:MULTISPECIES: hypothetical protein [unclassified Streptomyces]|uniref:double-stranded RNA binding motif domain-containing protein n=1 Tax=unclassified Streptomyces TaxID=2593676 RepID=UPI0032519944
MNEFHRAGHITPPDYRPPTPTPTGFATVTAVHRGQQLIGEGTGSSKRQARAEAADRLLKALRTVLGAADEPPSQPAPEPATTSLPLAVPAPPVRTLGQEPPPVLSAGPADLRVLL